MDGRNQPSGPTEAHIIYRYIGDGAFINGLPARDLYAPDLIKAEHKENITPAMIAESGMYEPMDLYEILPFCGAALPEMGRCRAIVDEWGQRCPEHMEATNDAESL